jgi:hypothetical protein
MRMRSHFSFSALWRVLPGLCRKVVEVSKPRETKREEGMGIDKITGTLKEQKDKISKILGRMTEKVAELDARLKKEDADYEFLKVARVDHVRALSSSSFKEREKVDRTLECHEARLRSSERLIESIKLERDPIVAEIETLRSRLLEIEKGIKVEQQEAELSRWNAELQRASSKAAEDLQAARSSLSNLATLMRAITQFDSDVAPTAGPSHLFVRAQHTLGDVLEKLVNSQKEDVLQSQGFKRLYDGFRVGELQHFKVFPVVEKDSVQ